MLFQKFLDAVQDRCAMTTTDAALWATRATLQTLAERVGPGTAQNLGQALPPELGQFLDRDAATAPEPFDAEEFLARVSRREGRSLPEASDHARAVLDVLREAVGEAGLPDELRRLADASGGSAARPA